MPKGEPLFKRRFIPARLFDNPYLSQAGDYEAMLLSLPETQRKQLLEGDWDVAEGAAFVEFSPSVHVIPPFEIPLPWERVKGIKSNINEDLAKEVIDWIRYYNGASDLNFSNYRNYIESNEHWPEINQIHLRAESKISFRDDYNEIINFFSENEPRSGWGKIYLGNALLNSGKNIEGSKLIKEGYINCLLYTSPSPRDS